MTALASLFVGRPLLLGPSLVGAALPDPEAPVAPGVALAFLAELSSPSVAAFLLIGCAVQSLLETKQSSS